MPDDLAASLPYIKSLIEAFRIPILIMDGYEADDIIGTLAKRAEKHGLLTYMMTPDKDFGQLVSENIKMYKPAKAGEKAQIWGGVAEICERYSISTPEQLIDILGLWGGDASDNIPGVPGGIGEKTAAKLISTYGSIEKLLESTHELKGKQKENLENFAEQALQSKQLATIITEVPIDFDPEKLKLESPDMEKLQQLFDELEFKTFARRMFQDAQKQAQASDQQDLFSDLSSTELESFQEVEKQNIHSVRHDYVLVDDETAIKAVVAELIKEKKVFVLTQKPPPLTRILLNW